MQLAVVLVQTPVGPAHRLVVGLAAVQTHTLAQTRLLVQHTVPPQATVLVLTCRTRTSVAKETWDT